MKSLRNVPAQGIMENMVHYGEKQMREPEEKVK